MASTPTSVLYIDDDPEEFEIFQEAFVALIPSGRCLWANTCTKGLALVQSGFLPDYIFVDGYMPMKGAPDCITELRKVKDLAKVPIVLYSGQSRAFQMEVSDQFQPISIIHKPNTLEGLRKTITSVFKKEP
jgi:CheY-like chemotaxis protein